MTCRRLLSLLMLCLLAGCVTAPAATPTTPGPLPDVQTIQTMLSGLDQCDGGSVLVLNTGHGPFVIPPDVPAQLKSDVHEELVQAREHVITIRYREMPPTKTTIAHKQVMAIIIQGKQFRLHR